ncbi:MAG: hypothetical protein NZM42_04505 [Gemmatales bacterium]|nr:hypothetical protein [Gemmatales bacterium]
MKRLVRAETVPLTPQLQAHLLRDQYGSFRLTRAIRPGPALEVIPQAGYRIELSPHSLSRLAGSVSAEMLWDVCLDLLALLGETVDVYLQSSHFCKRSDYVRRGVDRPVLMSYCLDFEELLLHDGCTGLAVIDPADQREVHLDEHKVLIVYARDWQPFARVLERYGVPRCDDLALILEAVHYHCSRPEYPAMFQRFAHLLGAEPVLGTVWDA